MALSRRLIELAADGVTDAQELGRLALETFPLPANRETAPGRPDAVPKEKPGAGE